jgi:hypothetical protein
MNSLPVSSSHSTKEEEEKKKRREKYKISLCSLPDLQFIPCGIKTNLKVPMVCKKKKQKQFNPYR